MGLQVYNTLKRAKEAFIPINGRHVGIYLCGPTVYGPAHLGHGRSAIFMDVIVRYLRYLNYKVRYVRNITDVGHLERDSDDGDDKIMKQAIIETLEPMELVQRYTNSYRRDMELLNTIPPCIEANASGHIVEQIEMIKKIINAGKAYVASGSVYFDLEEYTKEQNYCILSGRVIEDLLSGTRSLNSQEGKKSPLDFALWKNATPEHIMKWSSPWGHGYPGWHIECSAIATKYLGKEFDIHAGGMDLIFPHHECEIAQAKCALDSNMSKYWLHHNMVTINGQKMAKSLGNFITLADLFAGSHTMLSKPYSPMTLRFFTLQAHYRSTLSFSTEALDAAAVGYRRLMNGLKVLETISYHCPAFQEIDENLSSQIKQQVVACSDAINDDFNTAKVIASLFNLLHHINTFNSNLDALSKISEEDFLLLKDSYTSFLCDILGLKEESANDDHQEFLNVILELYDSAKSQKNYDQVDIIRAALLRLGISIKDTRTGTQWSYELR